MRLDRPLEHAQRVRGGRRAAVLFNDIGYELALGEPTAVQERQGELALELLERRFPGVKAAAREVEQPPSLSRQAGQQLRNGATAIRPRPARPREPRLHDGAQLRRSRRPRIALRALGFGAVLAALPTSSEARARGRRGCARSGDRPAGADRRRDGRLGDGRDRPPWRGPAPASPAGASSSSRRTGGFAGPTPASLAALTTVSLRFIGRKVGLNQIPPRPEIAKRLGELRFGRVGPSAL
jgi:hypothetical protein